MPTAILVWSWLFANAAPNSPFNRQQTGGFRDANTGEFISFTALKSLATNLSTSLASNYAIKPGGHVTIFCSNSVWYPALTFSTVRLGGIVTGSSPEYSVEEMTYILKASESELVFADTASWDTVCRAVREVGMGTDRVVLVGSEDDVRGRRDRVSIHDLIAQAKGKGDEGQVEAWTVPEGRSNKDIPCFLSFTSGTTSAPKGVRQLLLERRCVA